MERHFVHELEELKSRIIKMGSLAETAVKNAVRAFLGRDSALARRIIDEEPAPFRIEEATIAGKK